MTNGETVEQAKLRAVREENDRLRLALRIALDEAPHSARYCAAKIPFAPDDLTCQCWRRTAIDALGGR